MSPDSEDIDMALANHVVVSDELAVNVVHLEAAMVSLDGTFFDFRTSSDEDVLAACQLIHRMCLYPRGIH